MNTVMLGGLELDSTLIWVERYTSSGVAQIAKRTLGGLLIIQSSRLIKGERISLVSQEDSGWFTRVQVKALVEMANNPTGVYVLVFGAQTLNVCFDNTSPPAVDFRAIVPRTPDEDGDYFTGQIKLISV